MFCLIPYFSPVPLVHTVLDNKECWSIVSFSIIETGKMKPNEKQRVE